MNTTQTERLIDLLNDIISKQVIEATNDGTFITLKRFFGPHGGYILHRVLKDGRICVQHYYIDERNKVIRCNVVYEAADLSSEFECLEKQLVD